MDVIEANSDQVVFVGGDVVAVDCAALRSAGVALVVATEGDEWAELDPFTGKVREQSILDAAAPIWASARDKRLRPVYDTATGQQKLITQGEPIPEGYALEKTPEALDYQRRDEARAERDALLRASDQYVLPDRDLTIEKMDMIREYRQELRDWPETAGFPETSTLPSKPAL